MPIVGPIVGAISGSLAYVMLVELHHSPDEEFPVAEIMESYGKMLGTYIKSPFPI